MNQEAGETYQGQQRWLDERFNHINTILNSIRETVGELKDGQAKCVHRCYSEMEQVYSRLRSLEQRQAAKNGAAEHERETRQSENITWQMIIAVGTALSALGAFLGYIMGKG